MIHIKLNHLVTVFAKKKGSWWCYLPEVCLEDTFGVTLNAWYSNAPNGIITAKIIVLCVLFQASFTQYSRSSCIGTHMHILALVLAQTYPNHCLSSCWTSNCFVVKYMDRYIDPVSIMTLCRLWQTSQPEIYCETDIFCSEINTSDFHKHIQNVYYQLNLLFGSETPSRYNTFNLKFL